MTRNSPSAFTSSDRGGEEQLARLIDQYLPKGKLERGRIVRGVIVRVSPTCIVVDIGTKCEGIIEGRELERLDPSVLASLKPGDEISVCIVNADGPCGEIALSLARAQLAQDWKQVKAMQECGETLSVRVASANRGGLIAEVGQLRGFIPASQLSPSRNVPRISDPRCMEVLQEMVGQCLEVQIIEVDPDRNRLILSERIAERGAGSEREQLFSSLKEGEIRRGRVSNLTEFGAFVDMGGIDGLVHLSEMSWKRLEHPSEMLRVGQEVEVLVLSVERERRRVALSIKRLSGDPWAAIAGRYQEGQVVDCCITRLSRWGAFACIVGDEAIEGLIPASELNDRHADHLAGDLKPGQVLRLTITRIEPERHRLALSLPRAELQPAAE